MEYPFPLALKEAHINEDDGYKMWEDYTTDLDSSSGLEDATLGEIYKFCQKEFGQCQGSMYVDRKAGGAMRIGWVFQKKDRYEDTHQPFLHSTWVEVLQKVNGVYAPLNLDDVNHLEGC